MPPSQPPLPPPLSHNDNIKVNPLEKTLLPCITEAFLSYCMTVRKTTVHRSEHFRVDKFVSVILMLVFIFEQSPIMAPDLNSNNSSTTFPVCKEE